MHPATIPVLILTEGVVVGAVALGLFLRKRSQLARCHRTTGEVIEIKEHARHDDGPMRYPVIRYLDGQGEPAVFESKYGRSGWKIQPGDRLPILVHPGHPPRAEVAQFMAQWGLPCVLGLAAASSLIAAPILHLTMNR